MKAHKGGFTFGVNQAEGVNTKPFHRAQASRNASVRHCPHDVVQCFGLQRDIIPERIVRALSLRYGPVGLRFYRMDKVRKFIRILNEEYRGVIANQIENALVGVKLGREPADIAHRVS